METHYQIIWHITLSDMRYIHNALHITYHVTSVQYIYIYIVTVVYSMSDEVTVSITLIFLQPIRDQYLGHVNNVQPIRGRYLGYMMITWLLHNTHIPSTHLYYSTNCITVPTVLQYQLNNSITCVTVPAALQYQLYYSTNCITVPAE